MLSSFSTLPNPLLSPPACMRMLQLPHTDTNLKNMELQYVVGTSHHRNKGERGIIRSWGHRVGVTGSTGYVGVLSNGSQGTLCREVLLLLDLGRCRHDIPALGCEQGSEWAQQDNTGFLLFSSLLPSPRILLRDHLRELSGRRTLALQYPEGTRGAGRQGLMTSAGQKILITI